MFRIDNSTAATALPVPAAAGTPGFFSNGNPGTGQPATILDADFCNIIQEELLNILAAAGITPSKTDRGQVLAALRAQFSASGTTQFFLPRVAGFALTSSWTVPAGVTQIRVRLVGGGGAGGSSQATGSGQASVAPGGNAGCYGEGIFFGIIPGSIIPITIGAGGVPGAVGAAGGNGGTSSFGTLLSAPGGHGGPTCPASTAPFVFAPVAPSFVATGGGYILTRETAGSPGIAGPGGGNSLGGNGAPGPWGGAGPGFGGSSAANSAQGYGSAGGGAFSNQSSAGLQGGYGSSGCCIVEY